MKKRFMTLVLAGMMALSTAAVSFAGQWQQDTAGWGYQNDDGSFSTGGWNWIDGKCYYFTPEGYCLVNTTTPDGFAVDASGAWVIDGVVQTQSTASAGTETVQQDWFQIDTLSFLPPAGLIYDSSDGESWYFANKDKTMAMIVASGVIDMKLEGNDVTPVGWMQEWILGMAVEQSFGTPQSSEMKQYTSGIWYRYQYALEEIIGIPGSMTVCARLSGNRLQLIAMAGDLTGFDMDNIMNYNVK